MSDEQKPMRPCASTEEKRELMRRLYAGRRSVACDACDMCERTKHARLGSGGLDARVAFVTDAPLSAEAEALLTRQIFAAMGLTSEDVFVTSLVKCFPPDGEDPSDRAIATCGLLFEAEINIVRPEVIVTMGAIASRTLTGSTAPISHLRGEWSSYHGIPLLPTLSPEFLLANPQMKRPVWEDLKNVMQRLGASGPAAQLAELPGWEPALGGQVSGGMMHGQADASARLSACSQCQRALDGVLREVEKLVAAMRASTPTVPPADEPPASSGQPGE